MHFGRGPGLVTTLLGSCVALVLWHPGRAVGGMCHYLLPTRPASAGGPLDPRYAGDAMRAFMQHLAATGTRAGEYRVALLGGGNMFPNQPRVPGLDVGQRNIAAGRELLARHGFTLHEEDAGGTGHRRASLDLSNGTLRVQHFPLDATPAPAQDTGPDLAGTPRRPG